MADIKKEQERAELHKMIWNAATDLVHAGGVDAWDFKQYVLGTMFYRYISENITEYINDGEREAGNESFDYAKMPDEEAETAREGLVKSKGFFMLPSELFCNVRERAAADENLNETLEKVFKNIESTFADKVSYGLSNTKDFVLSIFDNLKEMFTGKISANQMVGIVGISNIVVNTSGLYEYIYMLALISLSLGLTNLLPFPPLDGGKVVIYLVEAIRRKPMKEELEIKLQMLGFAILIALSIYVTYNDILRIV